MAWVPQYEAISQIIELCAQTLIQNKMCESYGCNVGISVPSSRFFTDSTIFRTRAIGSAISRMNNREKLPYPINQKPFMKEEEWTKYTTATCELNSKWPEYMRIFRNVESFDGPFKSENGELYIGVSLKKK